MEKRSYEQLRKVSKEVCRYLRKHATPAERTLWQELRGRRLCNLKFRRQYPLFIDLAARRSLFIADFYCAELHLVIELDGKIHELTRDRDRARDLAIHQLGITTIRFTNKEVEQDLPGVLNKLKYLLPKHPDHASSDTPLL
jgi:very-short-patch-repair endonuclease